VVAGVHVSAAGALSVIHRLKAGYRRIIGPYWHAIGRSEAHWTMLGSVIKVGCPFGTTPISTKRSLLFRQIAHGLGLSHVFPELAATATAGEVRRHYGPRWSNAADREVARRVWYTLVSFPGTAWQYAGASC
jgi:hypothetical protein